MVYVGQFGGVSVQQVSLCCVCGTVGGVSVQQVALWCVCVGRRNEMTAVLGTIHLFHERNQDICN